MVFPKPGLLLLVVPLAQALDNGVGLTPPMGFNDYQTGLGVADLEAVADAFESLGLRAAGYAFINSDAGWQSGRNATSGAPTPNMASLAAALNTRGFGLGLYSALSSVQCGGDPGGLYHEAVDAAAYAAWNVSYVKYDNCAEYALEPTARVLPMRRALNATGRRFVFSTEPFDLAPNLRAHLANLWRTTTDVAADAGKVYVNIDLNDKWAEFAGPGGFNDPDMLQVGKLGGNGGDDDVSNFLLWAVAKAPLLLSVNVSTLSPRLLALAKNPKILAVNQDALGVQGRKVAVDGAATLLDVGVEPCAAPDAFGDDPASVAEVAASKQTFDVVPSGGASLLRSGFYAGRCLALAAPVPVAYAPPRTTKPAWSAPLRAALAPCDADDAAQRWTFSTPAAVAYGGDAPAASLFSLATNGSLLTLLPETDAARAVNHVGGGPPAYGAAGAAEPCESPRVPRPMFERRRVGNIVNDVLRRQGAELRRLRAVPALGLRPGHAAGRLGQLHRVHQRRVAHGQGPGPGPPLPRRDPLRGHGGRGDGRHGGLGRAPRGRRLRRRPAQPPRAGQRDRGAAARAFERDAAVLVLRVAAVVPPPRLRVPRAAHARGRRGLRRVGPRDGRGPRPAAPRGVARRARGQGRRARLPPRAPVK